MLEDDADIRELLGLYLQRESMQPLLFGSPVEFLSWLDKQPAPPDLLILDLMMPELAGSEVITNIRGRHVCDAMPILVCSAKTTESDVILTLGLGADAYIRKPFSPRELVAQVTAMLRRAQLTSGEKKGALLRAGPLVVDTARKTVYVDKKRIGVTPTEYRLLAVLMERQGSVVTREELLTASGETDALDRVVDVHITAIRRKLGKAASLLHTSRSFGYYIDEEEQ